MNTLKTYHGSCECEQVRIEATFDLSKGTFKCNCRICTKGRFWGASVQPDALKVVAGDELLTRYWNNPVHVCDGRHDRFDREPEFKDHL